MAEEIVDIQDLAGVGPVTANKLRDAGYDSISSLAIAPVRELIEKAGLENSVALKISRAARETIQTEFVTAKQLYERRQNLQRLSFASSNLDKLLGGGLETQAITEFVGEFGAGKSQICMKLSVMAQLPAKDGGLEGKVLFVDTEGTFAAQRVYQMAKAMQLDPEKILDGIIYSRVYNSDHQILTVDHAFKICQEEKIKLLVVDSILSHFRGEYIGRESLSERQQRLNSHLHKLLRIAQALNLAVVITNQVQANPQAFFGDPTRPAGGNILAHASTHRVMLKKASKGLRVAKIIDSPYLPESEAYFQITEKGVEDAAPKSRDD
ncbi:MAG TPA: DNA repair and recombination protein RadA [Candidatus Dormibacteraeota bacterium]|jgi:DNA repair protein RadA|nr:DNA repair and recombination protein RadA [Candidatus Dormibacteraeota bacterium]